MTHDDLDRLRAAMKEAERVTLAHYGLLRSVSGDEACRALRRLMEAVRPAIRSPAPATEDA